MQRQREVPVVLYQEGARWRAQALGVEVATFGSTADEVRAAMIEALGHYFEDGDEQVSVGEIHVETLAV